MTCNKNEADLLGQIELTSSGYKGLLSEYGWVYLVNDTNRFLGYLYGKYKWTQLEEEKAFKTIAIRDKTISQMEAKYFKFIIPEKAVVYSEFLPKIFSELKQSTDRPALLMSQQFKQDVFYLDKYLIDAKSYGFLYFKGDTHVNWLGAYFVYNYIVRKLNFRLGTKFTGRPIPIGALVPQIAGYNGDLISQIKPTFKNHLNSDWKDLQTNDFYEYCVRYILPAHKQKSKPVNISNKLAALNFDRQIIVKENDDASLPSAVVFRDSTADFIIDLLAEHFRRVVFVWHQGEVIRDIIEDEKPDIVLHIMAERFVSAYGDQMVALA